MICGALGCRDDAAKRIRHPKHGLLVVCEDHVNGHEVVEDLAGDDQEVTARV